MSTITNAVQLAATVPEIMDNSMLRSSQYLRLNNLIKNKSSGVLCYIAYCGSRSFFTVKGLQTCKELINWKIELCYNIVSTYSYSSYLQLPSRSEGHISFHNMRACHVRLLFHCKNFTYLLYSVILFHILLLINDKLSEEFCNQTWVKGLYNDMETESPLEELNLLII
jgi:hypothetical protein